MTLLRGIFLLIIIIALLGAFSPAGAVLPQYTYRGTVTELDFDAGLAHT